MKKVLRIRKGEYLLSLQRTGLLTTFDRDKGLDISDWTIAQLGHIVTCLKEVGYNKVVVERIEENHG